MDARKYFDLRIDPEEHLVGHRLRIYQSKKEND
ncbi:MAG: hypothetical protein RI955_784 [Bacteroidota bacterium]